LAFILPASACAQGARAFYPIASTGQDKCYSVAGNVIACPADGAPLSGQDGGQIVRAAAYRDNIDGTINDLHTNLMWAKALSPPMAFEATAASANASRLGGHSDWRVPTIKELYSLIDFRGGFTGDPATSSPYIDTRVFDFAYAQGSGLGLASRGPRPIDVQLWSATRYVGRTMGRDETVFGVNFADGRIKGYPVMDPANRMQTANRLAVRLVRGGAYGDNAFTVVGNTVRDVATGLMWQRSDDGIARSWADALAYCEALTLDGFTGWHVPSAKQLHSIVDYARVPAINPIFTLQDRSAYFWTSTTHLESAPPLTDRQRPFARQGELAVYIAFGPAMGRMEMPPLSGQWRWLDVHGAGSQRSDPKTASPGNFPNGFGPQGDDIRGNNYARCVRRG
jgi:Protein of unknown function (DUF1566)